MKSLILRMTLALMFLLVGLLGGVSAHAASARATIDRDTVQLGETLTLNVELEGSTSNSDPDITVLQKDFDILGKSSSTSINIINGQSSSKVLWAVGLQPKREGTLTIPSLNIGGARTQALSVIVKAMAASSSTDASGKPVSDVMVELTVDPHAPYVQQQVRATLKLYYAVNLTEGNLEDPHLDGIVVKKLGQDKQYQGNLNGRNYNILERHYAITAEKSGAVTLPAVNFRGRAQDANDPNSFFNRGRIVAAHSDALQLDVRARPADSGTGPWLPAASMTLTADGVDATSSVRVGEPITLNLHLKAQGLGFEQLPELNLGSVDGAEVYPDKSATRTRDDGTWQYGERDRKFAIVPTRAGKLKLPEVEVRWWDTEHDRAAVASVPAQEIDVLPAAGAAPVANASTPPQSAADAMSSATDSAALIAAQNQAQTWRWLALASLLLWTFSALGGLFWYLRQRRASHAATNKLDAVATTIDDSKPRNAFRAACGRNDLDAAAQALLRWARLYRPDLRSLGELAALVGDTSQRESLVLLERARYGDGNGAGLAERVAKAFAGLISFGHPDVQNKTDSVLPPLYPTRI
ncbi:protein BatD [Pseudolysobacter antarcticus]|uniref:Protein BatD n=1 Tax=Pseudolysobacter antarcticus TaxID=2511995 RepID=A0A411HNF0_9GAMM|nr:BatD family protein [Pseudolysobacter antarcticus]QBB71986.1 protein BatD [Pseudolysobacter antarcticus]